LLTRGIFVARRLSEEAENAKGNLFNFSNLHKVYDFYGIRSSEETPMATAQYYFDFAPRPILRLCFIEEVIKKQSLITPPPSRPTLIALIERGDMEGKKTDFGYVVYEDSFRNWIKRMTTDLVAA